MARDMGEGRAAAGGDELRRELAETTEALRLRYAPLTEESVEPPRIFGRPPETGVQLEIFVDCAILMPQSAWGHNGDSMNNLRQAFDHARSLGNLEIIVDFEQFTNAAKVRSEDLLSPFMGIAAVMIQEQQKIHLVHTPKALAGKMFTPHMASFFVAHESAREARLALYVERLEREQK